MDDCSFIYNAVTYTNYHTVFEFNIILIYLELFHLISIIYIN